MGIMQARWAQVQNAQCCMCVVIQTCQNQKEQVTWLPDRNRAPNGEHASVVHTTWPCMHHQNIVADCLICQMPLDTVGHVFASSLCTFDMQATGGCQCSSYSVTALPTFDIRDDCCPGFWPCVPESSRSRGILQRVSLSVQMYAGHCCTIFSAVDPSQLSLVTCDCCPSQRQWST